MVEGRIPRLLACAGMPLNEYRRLLGKAPRKRTRDGKPDHASCRSDVNSVYPLAINEYRHTSTDDEMVNYGLGRLGGGEMRREDDAQMRVDAHTLNSYRFVLFSVALRPRTMACIRAALRWQVWM